LSIIAGLSLLYPALSFAQPSQVSGVLSAPVLMPTIGFIYMVGEAELALWNKQEASAAVTMFSQILIHNLSTTQGYLVSLRLAEVPFITIKDVGLDTSLFQTSHEHATGGGRGEIRFWFISLFYITQLFATIAVY
jgi:hypothetical protein